MNAVFADTFFYIALLRQGDLAHARSWAAARINRPMVTTESVVLEMGNACARASDRADFLRLVRGMRSSPRIQILPLNARLLQRGLERMAGHPDKDCSLTDCLSFVVMEDEDITEVLTGDRHFAQAGFQALLV